jgi:hypothetical protein
MSTEYLYKDRISWNGAPDVLITIPKLGANCNHFSCSTQGAHCNLVPSAKMRQGSFNTLAICADDFAFAGGFSERLAFQQTTKSGALCPNPLDCSLPRYVVYSGGP